jgi:hypothetical protein
MIEQEAIEICRQAGIEPSEVLERFVNRLEAKTENEKALGVITPEQVTLRQRVINCIQAQLAARKIKC